MSDSEYYPECGMCFEAPGKQVCSGCHKARYCSRSCQERAWEIHIFKCNTTRKPKSYQLLVRDIAEDCIPTNRKVLRDWGFDRCKTEREITYLFNVYVGTYKILDIPMKTLDQWRRSGVLFEELKKIHDGMPEEARGAYLPWLMKNKHILDPSPP
ncbi:hypothetical protein DFP72DRAFT_865734 [Ephemerocybe angulata]|uniref:MYND-type domain-containing protein n=1 Tax=Ephemerocybe angulata TaxID=980116 RepID=A0A8H6IKG8_9AGAR|nr:hypothetical protein DFP72DRAFT_865734 [Tulosesus angulatus]